MYFMSEQDTIQQFELSSWAAPTDEDIARFEALTPEQQRRVFQAQLKRAAKSGVSDRAPSDILKSVLSRHNNARI